MTRLLNSRQVKRISSALFLLLLLPVAWVVATTSAARAFEIKEVTSPSGIKAWLVEDYTVPIISLSLQFAGGSSSDPEGKEGLTSVLTAMMDEGAGDLDTESLKAELEALGIEIGFSTTRDHISGGMRLVRSDLDRAFELFSMILNEPGFEPASLERVRAGFISRYQRSLTEPNAILGTAMREVLFEGHAYSRPSNGDAISLNAISREDVIDHHGRLFARSNLHVGVVGAIGPNELAVKLDEVFANLPMQANFESPHEITPQLGVRKHIGFESPQGLVSLALPGRKRSDPEFFAAFLVNHILGGGTFSSRLFEEIREKRGLVYGVNSSMVTREHGAYLGAGFATRADQTEDALEVMLTEISRLAKEGPSEGELELAKQYVIGSYAINNLDTSSKIADVLVGLQADELGIDYIETRRAAINSVTLEQARAIAGELLGVEPTVITLGPGRS